MKPVCLFRYTLVSVRQQAPEILERGEVMESGQRSAEQISERLIDSYLAGQQASSECLPRHLRLHLREICGWSRPELPAQQPEAAQPKQPRSRKKRTKASAATPAAAKAHSLDAALVSLGGSATLSQLVKSTGKGRAALRAALTRCIEAGQIERAGEGLKTLYRRRQEE